MTMPLLTLTNDELLTRVARDLVRPLSQVKREAVESAMILCAGNRTEAAFRLGISRAALARMLDRWKREDA